MPHLPQKIQKTTQPTNILQQRMQQRSQKKTRPPSMDTMVPQKQKKTIPKKQDVNLAKLFIFFSEQLYHNNAIFYDHFLLHILSLHLFPSLS